MDKAPGRTEISPDPLKSQLEREYTNLLTSHIDPSNLYTFFDEAVEKLVGIIKKTTDEYLVLNPDEKSLGKELEDKALKHFGLFSVNETLDAITYKRMAIQGVENDIALAAGLSNDVFVPPTADSKYIIEGNGEGMEEKKLIPRLVTLVYILQNDLQLYLSNDQEGISIVRGETSEDMVRKQPYFRVTIPSLDRTVYICDEEGNASFIFSTGKILEKVSSIENIDRTDKATYKEIIEENPKLGIVVRYGPLWREQMVSALTNEFGKEKKPEKSIIKSDFEAPRVILPQKEGWETATSLMLSEKVKLSVPLIKQYADTFRQEHPEWFEIQMSRNNKPTERYHPDLIKEIEKHFNESEPQHGWKHSRDLVPVLDLHQKTVINSAEAYRKEYPEWFETKRNPIGRLSEYYHPDLIKKLQEQFSKISDAKEGWQTANGIAPEVDTTHKTIKRFVEQYRAEHPEWFEQQRAEMTFAEHYHPELVKLIIEHFNKHPLRKEGWKSSSTLIKELKRSQPVIKEYAETFRAEHPEWFEMQKNGPKISEHYHPDLVAKITEYFTQGKNG
jgi:hypothetical protein